MSETNLPETRIRELRDEFASMLDATPQPDGPGSVSAFYFSLSIGEVVALCDAALAAPIPVAGEPVVRYTAYPEVGPFNAYYVEMREDAEGQWVEFKDHEAALTAANTRAAELQAEVDRLKALINSPETADWLRGVPLEAAHQIERWGAEHDAGKTAWDWFWLIGYLAQKAAGAQVAGDASKAKHHTISTAAALLNWHRQISGENTAMRPGIDPMERGVA